MIEFNKRTVRSGIDRLWMWINQRGYFSLVPKRTAIREVINTNCVFTTLILAAGISHHLFTIVGRTLIQTVPQNVMVEKGTEAKFTCTATTDPDEVMNMRIDWKKDGQFIDYNRAQRVFKNVVDNSLTISGTVFLDTGKYSCVASNGIDSSEAGAFLIVQGEKKLADLCFMP